MKLLAKVWNIKQCLLIVKVQKNTEIINSRVSKTNNGKRLILSKCAKYSGKTWGFIKKSEAKGMISSLGVKIPFNKIPSLDDILF